MPFGMKNGLAAFQRLINQLTLDLEGCKKYILFLFTLGNNTYNVFVHCLTGSHKLATLLVNLTKVSLGMLILLSLGSYVVGQGEITPVMAKFEAITGFLILHN